MRLWHSCLAASRSSLEWAVVFGWLAREFSVGFKLACKPAQRMALRTRMLIERVLSAEILVARHTCDHHVGCAFSG
jgi:hypothetical protein